MVELIKLVSKRTYNIDYNQFKEMFVKAVNYDPNDSYIMEKFESFRMNGINFLNYLDSDISLRFFVELIRSIKFKYDVITLDEFKEYSETLFDSQDKSKIQLIIRNTEKSDISINLEEFIKNLDNFKQLNVYFIEAYYYSKILKDYTSSHFIIKEEL